MSNRWSYVLHSEERADYGVIVMLESLDGLTVRCLEFPGLVRPAFREMADYCDRHELYVTCVSTPNTIYADVQGRQAKDTSHTQKVSSPERILLSQVRRTDLLHPRLR